MPPEGLGPALSAAAEALGITLGEQQAAKLLVYLAMLERWNRTYNLTAIRDPQAMLTQHLADCLAVWPPVRRHLGAGTFRILDVGSGGGLPGAVLAILDPGLDVTCVDAVAKKAAFIRQVAGELRAPNLHAEHARAEALKAAPFDLVVSRAFAALADFTGLTQHLLAPNGAWMAMKGKRPADEIAALGPQVSVFHVEQLDVPGLKADRCLVWLRKSSQSPVQ